MDLSFNRKSIFRKSFRQRHASSSIPPGAAALMKSLKKNQSTRRSLRMSSKTLRCHKNSEPETTLKSGCSRRSPTPSYKFNSINNDEDKLLTKSPILKRQESFTKLSDTHSKCGKSTSPLRRRVSKVVSAMERTIWDTPKKQVSKLFCRRSSGTLLLASSSPICCNMELCGSYKVLVFD